MISASRRWRSTTETTSATSSSTLSSSLKQGMTKEMRGAAVIPTTRTTRAIGKKRERSAGAAPIGRAVHLESGLASHPLRRVDQEPHVLDLAELADHLHRRPQRRAVGAEDPRSGHPEGP